MKLVLVRHSRAYESNQDPERNLTDEGIREAKTTAKFLQKTNWKFSAIYTSPLNRALQTANILQSSLSCDVVPKKDLSPNLAINHFKEFLTNFSLSENLVFVLHMPDISWIASHILNIPEQNLFFSTGATMGINIQEITPIPKGILIFLYQPEMLESIQ
ncbi:MAG: SixA phosphatase family protein [Leptonema sp. (in: bacteria)]